MKADNEGNEEMATKHQNIKINKKTKDKSSKI